MTKTSTVDIDPAVESLAEQLWQDELNYFVTNPGPCTFTAMLTLIAYLCDQQASGTAADLLSSLGHELRDRVDSEEQLDEIRQVLAAECGIDVDG